MVRRVLGQAVGPAVSGGVVAAAVHGAALPVAAAGYLLGLDVLVVVPLTPVRGDPEADIRAAHPVASVLQDVGQGIAYVPRTPWLLAALLFFAVTVLAVTGPVQVSFPSSSRSSSAAAPAPMPC